jgi:hypothetical protein
MKTLSVNLIPRRRLVAQRVNARMRLWSGVMTAYAAVLCTAYLAFRSVLAGGVENIPAELEQVGAETAAAEAELKTARADLLAAERMLGAAQELRDHPDWSALLQSIATMRGNDVVLGSLELAPDAAKGSGPTVTRPARYLLRLTGLARTHGAATEFSLMLERTKVFASVTLTDTNMQTIGDRPAVAFAMECAMDESGGEAP